MKFNMLTGYTEEGPACKTLKEQGLAKCHPQSCDECPNYEPDLAAEHALCRSDEKLASSDKED